MSNHFTVDRYQISVALSNKQFELLESLDYTDIEKALASHGAHSVDYNGHFGANIFFTVDIFDNAGKASDFILNDLLAES